MKCVSMPWLFRLVRKTSVQDSSMNQHQTTWTQKKKQRFVGIKKGPFQGPQIFDWVGRLKVHPNEPDAVCYFISNQVNYYKRNWIVSKKKKAKPRKMPRIMISEVAYTDLVLLGKFIHINKTIWSVLVLGLKIATCYCWYWGFQPMKSQNPFILLQGTFFYS